MAKISLTDWTLDGLKNPQQLQAYILDKFEESTGGAYSVVDPNNVASFLIESFSTLASNMIKKIDDTVLPAIYPNRAVSASDLYRHLSDYDYLGLFSYPASTSIMLILDVTYLINNGIPVDAGTPTSNRQLIIPQTTQFKIGDYTFGLYYPIKIRVSPETRMFVAEYDTSVKNPLKTLSTNVLEYSMRKSEGLLYAFVKVPVYQFETSATVEPLVTGSGYKKVIPYKNKFYALKVTAEIYEDGEWSTKELALSLFGRTYDAEKPTAVFTVDPDNSTCTVEIPYVYFTKGVIRGNLTVTIYTTSGYLNYTIPTDTTDMVEIDMFGQTLDAETAVYAEPFRLMPGFEATPIATQIVGGSEGYSYEELRQRVVNNTYGISVLQTPGDIDTYFANEGYVTSLYKDGITDRVYNAHATLRWTDDSIVSCASLDTLITLETLKNTSTIIHPQDDIYTILPSTRYRFDMDQGICIPLTDTELSELNNLSATNKVAAFNNNVYTICPFHIQVNTSSKYPTTAVFDLTDADIDSNTFLTSRTNISQQLSVNSALMSVVPVDYTGESDMVTDKYRITINVTRTGLDDVSAYMQGSDVKGIKQFMVLVGLKKIDGSFAFAEAEWQNRVSNIDIFSIDISATSAFTQVGEEHAIRIKDPFDSTDGIDVLLSSEVRTVLCLRKSLTDSTNVQQMYLSSDFTSSQISDIENFVAVSENQLVVHFGKLVNELDARMTLTYSEEKYVTYDTTVLSTLEAPVYQTDSNGVPKVNADALQETPPRVVLDEKYPTGTLVSFTHSATETIPFSKFWVNNLKGCTAVHNGTTYNNIFSDGASTTGIYDDVVEGVEVEIKDMPIIPRFSITGAQLDASGVNPCIGSYMVLDVVKTVNNVVRPNVGASSAATNKWMKVTRDANGAVYYCLEIMDALKFLCNYVLTTVGTTDFIVNESIIVDGVSTYSADTSQGSNIVYGFDSGVVYKGNPLSEIDASDGMFALVIHDKSFESLPEEVRTSVCVMTSVVDTPDTDSVEDSTPPMSVLYFRSSGKWTPIMACDSYNNTHATNEVNVAADLKSYYSKQTISLLKTRLTTEMNQGKMHGFVYFLHRVLINRNSNYDFGTTDYSWTTDPLQYAAFVTNDENGIPSLHQLSTATKYLVSSDTTPVSGKSYYTKNEVTTSAGETVVSYATASVTTGFTDGVVYYEAATMDPWSANVNKWPWEVETWRKLKMVGGKPTYVVDNLFETEFDSNRMGIYCKYQAGQIRLNSYGKPLAPETPRQLQYLVNMLHVDAKLAETTAVKTSKSYPGNLVEVMRAHFENLGSIKNRLYTNTKLFFEPMRSIGYGKFYTDGETEDEYSLDIRMAFRLHVSSDIANDADMMSYMNESVIKIIDDHMAEGGCSMTTIAQLIKDANSDSVRYVDVLGIDGNETLQTMRCVDPEVRPHLKHELQLEDDGVTITLTRGLDIEFVVADA